MRSPPKSKSKSKFKSKSETSSLALVENASPLNIDINGACLRRSPRFTTLQNGGSSPVELTPTPKQLRLTHLKDHLRRSPRVNSAPAAVRDGNAGRLPRFSPGPRHSVKRQRSSSPEVSSNTDQKSTLHHEEKSLRRSPRLCQSASPPQKTMLVSLPKQSNGKLCGEKYLRQTSTLNLNTYIKKHVNKECIEQLDVKLFSGMTVRRSPRLSPLIQNGKAEVIVSQREHSAILVHQNKTKSKMKSTLMSNPAVDKYTQFQNTNSSPDAIMSLSFIQENGKANSGSFASLDSEYDNSKRKKYKTSTALKDESMDQKRIASFIGDPIADDEAHKRWGWRYELKDKKCKDKKFKINEDKEDEIIVNVKSHYARAEVGNCIFSLGDCALVEGEGEEKHVGKIVEFFQTTDRQNYFRVQWFYRIKDTVVQDQGGFHDKRRLFYSSIMNDNLIDCIIAKANVTHLTPRVGLKLTSISSSDFYYDMGYSVDYSTFHSIPTDNPVEINELKPHTVCETLSTEVSKNTKSLPSSEPEKTELALLDLYSGCGGMSTGLCYGAKVSSVNLVARWAVDSDRSASESLKLNHPETQVRNESAEDFLYLLKEWEKLCKRYKVNDAERAFPLRNESPAGGKMHVNSQGDDIPDGELEVSKFVDICYGDPSETGKRGLYFKVHWKGYSSSEDTWEPIENLSKCKDIMQDFVKKGVKSKILPLPGEVDVICGGPPCQGISGYNRFRNTESPLEDERNRQIVVFMDIVKYLKPKYVLMENVVDILRFDKGSLGRYALSRLVHMNYQARLGIVAAGCYGLPQFRLRVFLWGAHPSEILPQFPLPSHDVIVKYWPPMEFERDVVAYDEDQPRGALEKASVIQDAISDLPAVTNSETRDEMPYQNPPETELQRYIRSTEYEMTGLALNGTTEKRSVLYDHRPCLLFEDDYLRVCQIPKRKGANFRDLPGIVVGADNVARRHPTENVLLLPSGKPLVPDYAFTYEHGKSKRPFSRVWWDETLSTALTVPSCHNQTILHPEQDRVLTIREFARLQGFPDYYRFYGNVKERYCQIGNAVAVSVSRALGYSLGMAYRKLSGNEPLMTLPPKFSHSNYQQLSDRGSNPSVDPSHIAPSENQLIAPSVEPAHNAGITAPSDNQLIAPSVDPAQSASIIAPSNNQLMAPSMDPALSAGITEPSDNQLIAPSVDPAQSASIIAPSVNQLIAPSVDNQLIAPSMEPAHNAGITAPSDNQLIAPSVDPAQSASIRAPSNNQLMALSVYPALSAGITAPSNNQLIETSVDPARSASIILPSDNQLIAPSLDPAHSSSITALLDNAD